jgi:hypothetical protein
MLVGRQNVKQRSLRKHRGAQRLDDGFQGGNLRRRWNLTAT